MTHQPIPVFILGSGRSGTTITAALLNQLPGIQIAKETGYISEALPQLLQFDPLSDLSGLFTEINSWIAAHHWTHRASLEDFQNFCSRHGVSGGSSLIHYVWQLDSETPWEQLSFIGDNTPLYVLAIPALLQLMPTARFIHLVRDPRDVICSIRKMKFGANDTRVAAMEWHTYLGSWLMAERFIPAEQRIEIRYEDLCVQPLDTVTRLAEFLGRTRADAEAALKAHESGASRPRTGFEAVAAVSHHTRLSEPISPSRVGRFRTELTQSEIRTVEEMTYFGLRAYGYPVDEFRPHPLLSENRPMLLKAMLRDLASRCFRRLRGR